MFKPYKVLCYRASVLALCPGVADQCNALLPLSGITPANWPLALPLKALIDK